MPDKNAAAQRVLSIAKALRLGGYSVSFYGITKSGDVEGTVDDFEYEALPYPSGTKEWVRYAIGEGILDYISMKKPSLVITYNYPAIAQERVIRFCRKNGIKVIGDITEWYQPSNLLKKIDVCLRMRWSNKHLDGIIAISRFLNDYYKGCNTILLPPIIDTDEIKWKQQIVDECLDKIKLIYAGVPGFSKDRLDFIVNGIACVSHENLLFNIVGITKEQYIETFGDKIDVDNLPIVFHGRLSHNDTIKLLIGSDFQIFFRPNLRVNNAGFPTKFVEAMTAGAPVIMNRISNVDDYLKDGFNGIMIDNPVECEIREALERVSKMNRSDVDRMKANCIRDQFDYHQYVKALEVFMNKI